MSDEKDLERRLEALGRSVPASNRFAESVMNRVAAGEPAGGSTNFLTMRWVMRGAIGVAACVVVGVFAWALLVNEPQRAYGMAEVAKRLAGANSLYIAGHLDGQGAGFAMYADRVAGRAWRTDGPDATVAVGGTQRVERNDRAKTWTASPVAAVDARLTAEMVLQSEIMGDLLGVGRDDFRKVRTERVGAVTADVYEGRHKAGNVAVRVEVAVDPRDATPLRAEIYFPGGFGSKGEYHFGTIDRIEIDGPPPAGAFDAAAPAGFAVKRVETAAGGGEGPSEWAATASSGTSLPGGPATQFRMRYAFVLPGRSGVLLCWALYDPKRPAKDLALPGARTRIAVNGGAGYDLRTFRTDATAEGFHWRWSVAVPRGGELVGTPGPSVDVTTETDEYHLTIPALTFGREELSGLVREAQRVTLPAGEEPTLLAEIEEELRAGAK